VTAGTLKRRVGLGLLTAYGVGVMVGAGIYVLIGVVVGQAGVWSPLAFLLAALVVLPSALSYGELATRMPEAAGEVAFIERGFDSTSLAVLAGLLIVLAGMISGAAVLRGGVGYLATVLPLPGWVLIVALGGLLGLIAALGVLESLAFAAVFTVIEVLGLLLVAWAGFTAAPVADWQLVPAPHWAGIIGAVSLCFFAFIGFEDIENLAEEVRDPSRVLPRAILLSLAITALLYTLVALAAVRSVPQAALAASERPLALVWQAGSARGTGFLALIASAAAVNGVLAQIVMAARVLFGLSRRATVLAGFGAVHPRFGTPLRATVLVAVVVIAAALTLPVAALAETSSVVILLVFLGVNLAAIRIKRRAPEAPFRVPGWVPVAGSLATLAALATAFGVGT